MRSAAHALTLVLLLGLPLSAQDPAVFSAGDLWESFLPTHVGKSYDEVPGDPHQLYYLARLGNHDRQWSTPTQMYPGGENLHIPWKQAIEMVEYSPGINPGSRDELGKNYAYGFETPNVRGDRLADEGAHWVDPSKRHQLIYMASTPTNLGVNVGFRVRQWTMNHGNLNDFIAVELELTNTGVLDVDGDGIPESTNNRINCLTLNWRHEPINSMTNSSSGLRGSSGWFTGPTTGYDATPDPSGAPWDVPVVFSGLSPASLTETGPLGRPWAPDGGRPLGVTMNMRRVYHDIHTGAQWIAAKQGPLQVAGSTTSQPDKNTIYDSHPVGTGAQRGWFTSVNRNNNTSAHNAWESHFLAMGTFAAQGRLGWDVSLPYYPGAELKTMRPDPNWFDESHAGVIQGDPLSFVAAVRPEGERGQPLGDMKYLNTFAQNWEQGNPGALPDGSDSDWEAGYSVGHSFDGDFLVGIGPFSLEVGETMNLVLAEYGGFRLQGVRRARQAAQWAYESHWDMPTPPPTPEMRVASTPAGKAMIQWDAGAESAADFAGYKIYRVSREQAIDSRLLGVRLLDHYQEQTVENPSDEELAAFGVPNNPNISSDAYRPQTPDAWGPYRLIRRIPAAELAAFRQEADGFTYAFVDEGDEVFGNSADLVAYGRDLVDGTHLADVWTPYMTTSYDSTATAATWLAALEIMVPAAAAERDRLQGLTVPVTLLVSHADRVGAWRQYHDTFVAARQDLQAGDAGALARMAEGFQAAGQLEAAAEAGRLAQYGPVATLYYYVAAYDQESGVVAGTPYTSLETHRHNWNGRSGLWEGTYWWTASNPSYPDENDAEGLRRIGAPFSPVSEARPTAVTRIEASTPAAFALTASYPNPFNASTVITYDLAQPGPVRLQVWNAAGQRVATLVDEAQAAGSYRISWHGVDDGGRNLATGIYFCRLASSAHAAAHKMLLLR